MKRQRNTTLVIRMLKVLIGYFGGIEKTQVEMKVTLNGKKKNLQGTNSGGDKFRIHTNDLEHKEEINIQPEQKEETRILKNEESIRRLWVIFKHANI